jgi:hypothetical protein
MFNRNFPPILQRPWMIPAVLTLTLAALLPQPASANSIDLKLKELAPAILEYCDAQGLRNVGILKFRVQVGDQKSSFQVGTMNSIMAIRLENALIFFNDYVFEEPDQLRGITRNASQHAVEQFGNIDYLEPASRQKLLTGTYPLAWGKEKVKVDTFLTGTVSISADYTKTTVNLEIFDQANAELRPLELMKNKPVSFTVHTDRVTLSDLNTSFFLANREPPSFQGDLDPEEFLKTLNLNKQDELPYEEFLELKVYYNDQEVTIGSKIEGFQVATPKDGQKIHLTLKAKKEPIAVVLLVNGINTFNKETLREPEQYSRWVLQEVGKTYKIEGFYPSAKALEPFRVLAADQANNYSLADNTKLGKIEVIVFRQSDKVVKQTKLDTTFRTETGTANSYMEAKRGLFQASPPVKQGIILPGKMETSDVQLTTFDNPVHSGYTAITYFTPNGSKKNP